LRTSTKLIELLRFLSETETVSSTELREKHDGRTIASADRRGFTMEYNGAHGIFTMVTDRGKAFLLLEDECAEV
jgi:hypothetical protein